LFVAVPLDDEVRHDLSVMLRELDLPGRIQAPGDWHLTVRFIGGVDDPTCDRIVHQLATMPVPEPFDVVWSGLGAFPRPDRATVVWLGMSEGGEALATLAADVEAAVQRAGVAAEDRPYRPHLTLSRVRPPEDVRALLRVDGEPPRPTPGSEIPDARRAAPGLSRLRVIGSLESNTCSAIVPGGGRIPSM
jgi:2'-5' RNA ligase